MSASVLFDAPGPKAARRHLTYAVIGAVAVLALLVWVVVVLNDRGQLAGDLWKPFVTRDLWVEYVIPGLLNTLRAAAVSIFLAMAFGILLGLGRLSHLAPVRAVSGAIVEFFRAVPVLLMMIFTFFLFARNNVFSSDINPFAAVVTGLTLYNGSVIAELVRSGVFSLPQGQREAGLSIGLTPGQTLRSIQLPQALTAMLPALVSQLVVILKDSALGYQITYTELLYQSKFAGTSYANVVQALLVAAVLFILINFALTTLAGRIEQRLSRRGRTTVVELTGMPPAPGTVAGDV